MRYFYARLYAENERRMYQCYTADCLYYINLQLNVKMRRKYSEILFPEKQDNRSAQEMVDDLNRRLGFKVVK